MEITYKVDRQNPSYSYPLIKPSDLEEIFLQLVTQWRLDGLICEIYGSVKQILKGSQDLRKADLCRVRYGQANAPSTMSSVAA